MRHEQKTQIIDFMGISDGVPGPGLGLAHRDIFPGTGMAVFAGVAGDNGLCAGRCVFSVHSYFLQSVARANLAVV